VGWRAGARASGTPGGIALNMDTVGSLPEIADGLNEVRVRTAHGGERWYASAVKAVLKHIT